ncbi:MAG: TolC family protein [Armatimonadetes bacterium]|nr:TolC family protein [Armatimonadota bacterium]
MLLLAAIRSLEVNNVGIRRLTLVAVALLAASAVSRVALAQEKLDSLVVEAVEQSEELNALQARITATEASIRPAEALPDPMLSVMASNVPVGSFDLDRTPMTGIELGLEQRVPGTRKRRLLGEARWDEAIILRARYEDRRNDLVRNVVRAYAEVQYFAAALAVSEENKAVAGDLLAAAEARYATGKGLQQDVFRAEVRLSRMLDEVLRARQGQVAAVARLNRLLYREPTAPLSVSTAGRAEFPPLDRKALSDRALERNPRIWLARAQLERTETELALAEAGGRPDYTFGFRYRIRQDIPGDPARGDDFWTASVGMTLPWVYQRDTVDERVRGAGAAQAAAQADLTALENELVARVEELSVEVGRLGEELALLDTALLPQAEGALASSWAAYSTGKVEFLTLLDNQMNLHNLLLQRSRLLEDRLKMMAELEYTVGGGIAEEGA